MKKVLFISPFFYPELISTGKYNTDLAVQIRNQDLEVSILCSHPLYPDWKPNYSEKDLPGVTIRRGGAWVKYPSNPLLRRAVLEVWFFLYVFVNFRELRTSDALIVVMPPSLFVLATVCCASSVRVIGIVHDLQAIHLDAKAGKLKAIIRKLIKSVEKFAFRRCKNLIYLSSEMKDLATSEYRLEGIPFEIAYPFVTVDDFSCNGKLDEYFDNEYFNIVYSGALGDKQNPAGVFEIACRVIESCPSARFIFFSRGPDFEKLKKLNSNPRIIFNDLVSSDVLGELLVRSDLQLIPQATDTSQGSLPSKLPNILASGTMVYAITDKNSELEGLLSLQQGCFISNTWDSQENASKLSFIVNSAVKKYDRDDMLGLFGRDAVAKMIKNVVLGS